MENKDAKLVMILKYCLVQKTVTWHLLCAGGVLQCLECFLQDRINEKLSRYEEALHDTEIPARKI